MTLPTILRRLPLLRPAAPRPVSAGVLVQRWSRCPVHGLQLVSVIDPGCRCPR